MKKLLALLVFFGFFLPGSPLDARDATDDKSADGGPASLERANTELHKRAADAVVGIECVSGQLGYFGSGVVISADGLVLTSTTVVPENAQTVTVYARGYRKYSAQVVRVDNSLEACVVRLDRPHSSFLPLADSTETKIGDLAFTLGNPFYTITRDDQVAVSMGIVSGRYHMKSADEQSRYEGEVLETDAAINPGSNGGPLVNCRGEVIGIIGLGFSAARWLGTAVPIDVIKPLVRAAADQEKPAGEDKEEEAGEGSHERPTAAAIHLDLQAAYARAVENVAPALVSIRVERAREKLSPTIARLLRGLQAKYFQRPETSVTGLLIDAEGHVLTSWFNVSGKVKPPIKVKLADGTELEAMLLGRDEGADLALLKVELPAGTKFASLAGIPSTKPVSVGASALVVARSMDPPTVTATRGVVAALGRMNGTAIQIDAPTDYGNAGGAVVTLDGRILGIAAQVGSESIWGQNSGIGFAMTAEYVTTVLPELKKGTIILRPEEPFLGVRANEGALDVLGASIMDVIPGSAADAAGIRGGDVIVEFDGQQVANWTELVVLIRQKKVGDKVKLKILRREQEIPLEVTIGRQP